MTNNKPQVFASNEILGATLTAKMSKSEIQAFSKDPKSFISASLDADTRDVSFSMVENSADSINLALPYYSQLDSISASSLQEHDIDSVSGGEIVISLTIIGVGLATTAGAVAAGVAGVQASIGKKIDNSDK